MCKHTLLAGELAQTAKQADLIELAQQEQSAASVRLLIGRRSPLIGLAGSAGCKLLRKRQHDGCSSCAQPCPATFSPAARSWRARLHSQPRD